MDEAALIRAMTQKGHTEATAKGAIAGRGYTDLAREYLGSPGQLSQISPLSLSAQTPSSNFDVLGAAKQLLGFQQQANQPAVQSLQAQVGEVGQSFAGQRQRLESGIQPLRDRYNQILEQMKGRVSTDLSREYGKRGIPLSSGMFEQDLTSKINPITRDIGLASEQGVRGIQDLIAGLGEGESSAKRNILNAIAQLQAGEPSGAITQALSLMGQQQQAESSRREEESAAATRAFQERVYGETTLPESQASIKNILSTIANRGSSGSSGDFSAGLSALAKQFGF